MDFTLEEQRELIKKARPELKENSISQYQSQLNKLKKLFDGSDYEFLKNPEAVLDKIKNNHYTSQRNSLNAIIVLLKALNEDEEYTSLIDEYISIRDGFNNKYEDDQLSGKISEKQKVNFVELSEIDNMLSTMEKQIKESNLKKKESLNGKERELLMVYTLFSFLKRIPTRNDMAGQVLITKTIYNKLSQEEKQKTNYLVKEKTKMTGIYNQYKTSKKYKESIINIPKDLEKILNLYIKKTDKKTGDVLFVNSMNNPLNRNQVSQLLLKTSQKYLGKNISTTMMRKVVASHHFADKEFQEKKAEQANLAKLMNHSVDTQDKIYVKSLD